MPLILPLTSLDSPARLLREMLYAARMKDKERKNAVCVHESERASEQASKRERKGECRERGKKRRRERSA